MNLQNHFENFKNKSSGMPNGYLFDESFKYTNLKSIFEEDFDLIRKSTIDISKNESLKHAGVQTQLIKNTSVSFGPQEYFSQLNVDFSDETLEVSVDKNTKIEKPIQIELSTKSGHCSAQNIKITVGEQSSVQFFVRSQAQSGSLSIPQIHVNLGRSAAVEFIYLQDDSPESFNFMTTYISLAESSNLKSLSVSLGGKMSRHHLNISHSAKDSSCSLRGAYLSASGQQMDHYTIIDHAVGGCTSTQHYKGILGHHSRAVFSGKVLIRAGAAKASSEQLNNNLLLDSTAEIDSKPELEIFNDDVKATHGSTVGQLSPEEIFYLQSRGLSKEKAIELLSLGFVAELISDVSNSEIKTELRDMLEAKLKSLIGVKNI